MYNITARTLFIGQNQIYLPTCHSTNEQTSIIQAERVLPEGTLVITDHQTSGKGQMGNTWEAEPLANLTFSILLKPNFLSLDKQFYLNIVSSLAVQKSMNQFIEGVQVKWPNDVVVNGKKICGILIQNTVKKMNIDQSIVGIGLNVNQELFVWPHAVSMKNIGGRRYDKVEVLTQVLEYFEKYYLCLKEGKYNLLTQEYLKALYLLNQRTQFVVNDELIEGEIQGVEESGLLRVFYNDEVKLFNFKEIGYVLKE